MLGSLAILWFNAHAQLNKGRKMIGGDISFSQNNSRSANQTSNTNRSLNTRLRYGYFMLDNLMLGLYGEYFSSSSKYKNTVNPLSNGSKENKYSAGLFLRYYKTTAKNRLALFGQLYGQYGMGTTFYVQERPGSLPAKTEVQRTIDGYSFGINPGITWFITDRFAIESTVGDIGYFSETVKDKAGTNPDATNSGINFQLYSNFSLGFNFYFGAVKKQGGESSETPGK